MGTGFSSFEIVQGSEVCERLACSRLRDSGGKSFSNKKCEKRAGAGALAQASERSVEKVRLEIQSTPS